MAAKRDGKVITEFPVFLIGQLAKNDTYANTIKGSEIIDFAMAVIDKVHEKIGGRIVVVECADKGKLLKFYHDNEFEIIRRDDDCLVQLIRMIN